MLEGVVSKSHFSNLTRLTTFFAYGNRLTLNVSHDWIPPFQLEYLSLRLWNLGPKFPPWLCSQRNLWYLDISNAQISDVIPPSIWNLSSQSYYLNLSHNQINGEIPNNPSILSTSVTDLSSNQFKGSLPYISSSVIVLDLSDNSFSKSISSFLCFKTNDSKFTGYLNLEKNNLSGKIPGCWMKWNSLVVLNLANNNFSGSFPASIGSLTLLKSLHLYNNKFSREQQQILEKFTIIFVIVLDLSDNSFSKSISSFLCFKTNDSKFTGYLNLEKNNLSGKIPGCWMKWNSLVVLNLANNNFSGSFPASIGSLTLLKSLHLYNNKFSREQQQILEKFTIIFEKL
nr:receptor-like protein EIX2 [Quercus suber]